MNPRLRKAGLAALLAVALALVIADQRGGNSPARGANSSGPGARSPGAKTGESLQPPAGKQSKPLVLPERLWLGESRSDLFSSYAWQPSRPKSGAAPVTPTAPPMPYRFAGKVVRGDEYSIMLSKGDLVFPVKEGETLDGAYRVESIGDDRITLMYLPLRQRESIPVASALPGSPAAKVPGPAAQGGSQPAPPLSPPRQIAAPAPPVEPAASSAGLTKGDSGPARLHWVGPQRVTLGASFDVSLKLTSGQPLQASPMHLRFDPAYLQFIGMKPGTYFNSGDRNFSYRASPDGSIFVGASNQNPTPAADAELLVLTFRPVKPAPAAELSVASLNLQGQAGRPITFSQLETFKTTIAP